MKKVINITLGAVIFAIEQEAFDVLFVYLEDIKRHLSGSDDDKEIINDIESALAEKFILLNKSEKFAITTLDVNKVIEEMGSPADFKDEETNSSTETSQSKVNDESSDGSEIKKRLYRDKDGAVLAGVASGLARYFDIDPVIVRLAFVIAVFFNGLGLLAYIILWLVVPLAVTTEQKYAMRGEKVTLNQIHDRVKKKLSKLDVDKLKTDAKSTWGGVRPLLDKVFGLFGSVLRMLLTALRYLLGLVLMVGGVLGIAGVVVVYSVVLLSEKTYLPLELQTIFNTLTTETAGLVAIFASFITFLIPLKVLVLSGVSIVMRKNYFTIAKSVALGVVWVVAIAFTTTVVALELEEVIIIIDNYRVS